MAMLTTKLCSVGGSDRFTTSMDTLHLPQRLTPRGGQISTFSIFDLIELIFQAKNAYSLLKVHRSLLLANINPISPVPFE